MGSQQASGGAAAVSNRQKAVSKNAVHPRLLAYCLLGNGQDIVDGVPSSSPLPVAERGQNRRGTMSWRSRTLPACCLLPSAGSFASFSTLLRLYL